VSADIEIIQREDAGIDLHIKNSSVGLSVHEWWTKYAIFWFDMTKEDDRNSIQNMIAVLQHQLEIHHG
jgi:hypothetical protein